MALKRPGPNDKLAYFTKRIFENNGRVLIWRFDGEEEYNVEYTCPACGKAGEFKRAMERIKVTKKDAKGKNKKVQTFRFQCESCGKDIDADKWVKGGLGKTKLSKA